MAARSKADGRAVPLLLGAWAIAFAGAFVAFALTAPEDYGFTAGINRVAIFMGWQLAAAVLSVACAVAARRVPRGRRLRRLGFVPLGVTCLGLLFLVGLGLWGMTARP